MRTYTRAEIFVAAQEGDSICMRCGSMNYGTADTSPATCEECGALAVVPAENIAQVARLIEEE